MKNIELSNKLIEIKDELKRVYLHDERPWIIGYSGGKDSTAVVQLVYEMLQNLKPYERNKPVYIISSDTLIENPIILNYLKSASEAIGKSAGKDSLPIHSKLIHPDYTNTFWTNIIGKGLPTPTSIRFRWCTEKLKIKPTDKFIEKAVEENGEVIVLLGVRKAESNVRKRRIENREIEGYLLTPHSTLHNTYVYNPIVELSTDDIWEILLDHNGDTPWGTSNNDLFNLYLGADSGECPFTITKDSSGQIDTPSCGNSRFGCWICTVVQKDKSLTGFIENGEESLLPLLNFRNWLLSIRDKHEYRLTYRRDGHHYYKKIYLKTIPLTDGTALDNNYIFTDNSGNPYLDLKNSHENYRSGNIRNVSEKDKIPLDLLPLNGDALDPSKIFSDDSGEYINILGYGPFTFEARKLILTKLLELQKLYDDNGYHYDLITIEELRQIDRIWDLEEDLTRRSLVAIYYQVMGRRLSWDKYKIPLYDANTLDAITKLSPKYDLRDDLVNRLLIETNNLKYYSNKTKLSNTITKLLQQRHWHQFLTEEIEHDNQ